MQRELRANDRLATEHDADDDGNESATRTT